MGLNPGPHCLSACRGASKHQRPSICDCRCIDALIKMGVLVPTSDRQSIRRTAEFFLNSFQVSLACPGALLPSFCPALVHLIACAEYLSSHFLQHPDTGPHRPTRLSTHNLPLKPSQAHSPNSLTWKSSQRIMRMSFKRVQSASSPIPKNNLVLSRPSKPVHASFKPQEQLATSGLQSAIIKVHHNISSHLPQ